MGHMKEVLADWLKREDSMGIEIETCVQREARGTGDAINTARGMVEGPFLVMNGDVLVDRHSLGGMVRAKHTSVAAKKVENPQEYGVFEVERGYVSGVAEKVEKPPSNLANVGSYVFEPDIFDRIDRTPPNPKRNEIEITDTLQGIIDEGLPVSCYEVAEWYELGKPWDVINLNEAFLERMRHEVHLDSHVSGKVDPNVSVGRDSVVDREGRVMGPSVIGDRCRIEGDAIVGPYCSIGDGSILSECTVKGTVVMEECRIAKDATVGYSVLAPGVSVGKKASIICHGEDSKPVRLVIKNRWMDSGRASLGAILGDGCRIGDGAVVHAGAMLDPDTDVPPGSEIGPV